MSPCCYWVLLRQMECLLFVPCVCEALSPVLKHTYSQQTTFYYFRYLCLHKLQSIYFFIGPNMIKLFCMDCRWNVFDVILFSFEQKGNSWKCRDLPSDNNSTIHNTTGCSECKGIRAKGVSLVVFIRHNLPSESKKKITFSRCFSDWDLIFFNDSYWPSEGWEATDAYIKEVLQGLLSMCVYMHVKLCHIIVFRTALVVSLILGPQLFCISLPRIYYLHSTWN